MQINVAEAQISIKWDKAFGGSNDDVLQYQQQTSDGGYILGGTSNSPVTGNKSADSKGQEDYWIVKVDANGSKQWDKTYGGSKKDYFQYLQPTSDGGYILGGYSNSPVSGDKSVVASAEFDYWIVKVDALGNKQWDKSFGGIYDDFLVSVQQTSDKGYILGGTSGSPATGRFGMNKLIGSKGEKDYWVVKLDANGKKEWDKTIGGKSFDFLRTVKQTNDNGYILGGYSYSPSSVNKSGANKGFADYWIVKLNSRGLIMWNKTIGGSGEDVLQCLELTKDGGFILGGTSSSPVSGNKTQASKGETDYWLVKVNEQGRVVWDKTIGGNNKDNLRSIKQTSDGGFILGGFSTSGVSGNKTESSNKDVDFWVVKVNSSGAVTWDKTIGGSKEDGLQSVQQISNGEYILGGYSQSSVTKDRTAASKGSYDFWLISIAVKEASDNVSGTYSLTSTATGEGTIVTSSKTNVYISGAVVSLTAKPMAGYRFVGWSGDANGTQNPLTITMDRNKRIAATFAPIESGIYEAEQAGVHGGVRKSEHEGFSGKGYVDFLNDNDDFVQWIIPGLEAANYELSFRYANGGGKDIPLKVFLNGKIIEQAKIFNTTKSWSSWSYTTVKTTLKAGINIIRVKSVGKGGPNMDLLRLTTSTNGPVNIATANSLALEQKKQIIEQKNKSIASNALSTEWKASPNPFNASITFNLQFSQDEEYELNIYDLNGNGIKAFAPGAVKADNIVRLVWEATSVKSGIYVAKLKTQSGVQTLRIFKN
ncbi:InlB B-repeat-containing protein [Adhaeribacter radiodurans]|uniref:T9SS type A sorting domain-containing protein n=1 Tax=Adhaeribacter radiodurans TaxID=2745197 RepID=A0A7L7L3F4_9BACT|nr:T9SS type A sorting domain-containing protein [Adhaeribacter radiodurans]QMU27336.1 T9SS type A sorting domain-containing protein [Adhaeribacter radiodurans]